jgi:hypothetical protein
MNRAFPGFAAQSSVNLTPTNTTENMVWQGRKDQYFRAAIKRILVLDGFSHVAGHSGPLAPKQGLPEPIGNANHKMVLRKDAGIYNYRP